MIKIKFESNKSIFTTKDTKGNKKVAAGFAGIWIFVNKLNRAAFTWKHPTAKIENYKLFLNKTSVLTLRCTGCFLTGPPQNSMENLG